MFLVVDDGSGHQIDLIAWKTPPPRGGGGGESQKITRADLTGVKLYSIVKAKGCVNEFWGRKQVLLKRITVLKDTNDEMAALAETTEFKRNVLSKPWVVSDDVVAEEKRKLTMDEWDEVKERRKWKKQRDTARKAEELEVGEEEKENMSMDSLIGKPEERRKRKTPENSEILSPKRKKPRDSIEPAPISDTSYRGHRRPPGHKPPSLQLPIMPSFPPELLRERGESPPMPASSFRGRRRTTPVSTPNLLPPPIPITDVPPASPPLPSESTYRGRRRAHKAEKLQLELVPETNALGIPINPEPTSTYRGRRRILKLSTEPPAPPPLEPVSNYSQQLPAELSSSSYRGRRRISKLPTDAPAPPPPEPVPNYSQQLPAEPFSSSYRGRRRNPSDTAIAHAPELSHISPAISYRERWRIMKTEKAAALSGIMLVTPEFSGVESISPYQAPKPPPADEEDFFIPSMSTYVPTPPPDEVTSQRSRRGDRASRYTRYPDDAVPPPPPSGNPSQVAESTGQSSSYRGRRRA